MKIIDGAFIDENACVDGDAIIYAGVTILGKSRVEKGAIIYPNVVVDNSIIGEGAVVKSCTVVENSVVGAGVKLGPLAHLREGTQIMDNCRVGNFVEIKNSVLGAGTKVGHLAYVGDACVGEKCNIGAGVVFANFSGKEKHRIVVEDHCFVGCNSTLVAPVKLAENTFVCAGTVVTKNTQAGDFVIGRVKETIKENRAKDYFK